MATRYAIAALVTAMMTGAPAYAQSVPEGQSCGGLLCDMGVFGHKTEPKPPAAPPAPVHAEAVPTAVAAEPADPEPKPKAARKKKHVAKTASKDKASTREAAPSEAEPRPVPVADATRTSVAKTSFAKTSVAKTNVAKGPAPVVRPPVPFGWEAAATQPPVAPAEPQAEPVAPQVAQAKPKPADGSTPVNVINLYSALPSAGIRPLY